MNKERVEKEVERFNDLIKKSIDKRDTFINDNMTYLAEFEINEIAYKDSGVTRVKGKIYWFVTSEGVVSRAVEQNDYADTWRHLTGNYFSTEQETIDCVKFLSIQGKVREIARRFPPCDWENEIQKKWCLKYSFPTVGVVDSFWTSLKASSVIHCSSPEFLDICLSEIGKDDLDFYCKYEV
jgi:hypothetical protein